MTLTAAAACESISVNHRFIYVKLLKRMVELMLIGLKFEFVILLNDAWLVISNTINAPAAFL
jgi:hypothetical protein